MTLCWMFFPWKEFKQLWNYFVFLRHQLIQKLMGTICLLHYCSTFYKYLLSVSPSHCTLLIETCLAWCHKILLVGMLRFKVIVRNIGVTYSVLQSGGVEHQTSNKEKIQSGGRLCFYSPQCDLYVGELGVTVSWELFEERGVTYWAKRLFGRHLSLPNTSRRNASGFNVRIIKKSGDITANPPSHISSKWIILFEYPSGGLL